MTFEGNTVKFTAPVDAAKVKELKIDLYDIDDVKKILSDYNQLVDVTESVEFNPYVFSFGKYKKEFDLFFN